MEITERLMTRNDCYSAGRKIDVKGIMIHSTAVPGVRAGEWYDMWNRSYSAGETDRQVCVHAFCDDTDIYQYLPWDHRGWHAGGAANAYFRRAFNVAVSLTAYLCRLFGLTERDVITHCEGHSLGIASDHADVMHWFPLHGESMDTFRSAVSEKLRKNT